MAKSPKVVRPMAVRKQARNPKARGPARTAKTVVTGQRCERERCGRAAVVYRVGQWLCVGCDPGGGGDPNCSHSLGDDTCSYCGADLREDT